MAAGLQHQRPQLPMANPSHGLGFPAQAPSQPPRAFRVLGRHPQLENGDICGEYCFVRNHGGHPIYQNRTTGIVIRFFNGRWLMDRGGIRDSDVCVAFAPQLPNCNHPAQPELVWHVWDSKVLSHLEDPEVFAIDAPEELSFVGRQYDRENAVVNGKYTLASIAYGRAVYKHQKDDLVICYNTQEHRWMISDERDVGSNVCSAWADAVGSAVHPGDGSLQWQFWEPERGSFQGDPSTGLVNAPETVSVIGRHPQSENARINGTYHLAGVHSGRPVYIQPGTQAVIRYSPKNNWWLIDCEGLAQPSLMSRLYQWVLTGDSENAQNLCSAWANARHTEHPGNIELEWNVWESAGSRHKPDTSVAVTAAPLVVQVSGRDVNRENPDINGEYQLLGGHQGYAAYNKPGTQYTIYFSKHGRWVIDRHGFADTGVCAAYVEGDSRFDYPTGLQKWHVYETTRGAFVPDPAVSLSAIPCEIPAAMPISEPHEAMIGELPDPSLGCRGVKRGGHVMDSDYATLNGYGMEQDFGYNPQAKFSRSAGQGVSRWLSIFGA